MMRWLPMVDRSWLRSRLVLVAILLLLLAAASLMGERSLLRLHQMLRTRAALTHEVERLAGTNAALAEEVRAMRNDPARIEAIAREELGLVKPGETVYEFRATVPPHPPADPR